MENLLEENLKVFPKGTEVDLQQIYLYLEKENKQHKRIGFHCYKFQRPNKNPNSIYIYFGTRQDNFKGHKKISIIRNRQENYEKEKQWKDISLSTY